MFKKLLFVTLALVGFSAAPAFAAETSTPEERPMGALLISQGHLEVAGSGIYTKESDEPKNWSLDLNPKVEYFVLNRLSVGGTIRYFDSKASPAVFEVGPSLTYYITHTSKWAFSIDQSVRYVKPEGHNDNYLAAETGLAIDYFITESLAIGPEIKALYSFNGDTTAPSDATRVLVGFSLFL